MVKVDGVLVVMLITRRHIMECALCLRLCAVARCKAFEVDRRFFSDFEISAKIKFFCDSVGKY